jgi:peptide chain release factor 2
LRTVFDLANKEKRIAELDKESGKPDFWDNPEAAAKSQELNSLREESEEFNSLKEEFKNLSSLVSESKDEEVLSEIISEVEKKTEKWETRVFLSGRYDKGNALLSIYSGAGGQDAQDWATMLSRMYERYCAQKGFQTKILEQSFGDPGGPEGRIGTKSVTLEVKGKYAFGLLKGENGVHRLVRLSPFNAKSLRQTSFALVEVLPEMLKGDEKEIKINPDDLKIDTYRASGPGGQYVNRTESAGIVVSCQSERLQGNNKDSAMKILLAKLIKLEEDKKNREIKEIKGDAVSASWGNQIRSYVLHPYKMVKDLRTGVEVSNPDRVLDGDIEEFVLAETKLKND